eukprot:gene1995-1451_t
MISPPNRSRWNGSGDEVSTSKLGMMLSNMQTRLVIDESDDSKSDDSSPGTTVNGVEPAGVLETTPSTETQDNIGASKLASTPNATIQFIIIIYPVNPWKKIDVGSDSLSIAVDDVSSRGCGCPTKHGHGCDASTEDPSSASYLEDQWTDRDHFKVILHADCAQSAGNDATLIVERGVSSSASTSTSNIGSTAIRKKIGDTDNDSVVSTSSRATTASKIPSRSATPNRTAGSTQRQVSASTPTASSAAKTPSRLTPSPKSTSSAKPLSGSFSDQSTASTNGVKSARTPVKAPVPKISHTDSSKSLTRKTSFGSVGSVASATPSVQSTVSSASKARRPSIGGNATTKAASQSQSSLPVKPQKSVDELDEIYSTENVVSSLKAQRVPSAQLLRTTIQRLDTAAVPHTMNPLRRNSLTQSQTQNGTGSNNNSFTHARRDSKSGKDDMNRSFSSTTNTHEPEAYPSPTAPVPPSSLFSRSKSNNNIRFRESPRKTTYPPPYPVKALHPVAMDSGSERACYMPSLVHSTPAAISAIYRAAIAKEAASSQTMLGRISSFRR